MELEFGDTALDMIQMQMDEKGERWECALVSEAGGFVVRCLETGQLLPAASRGSFSLLRFTHPRYAPLLFARISGWEASKYEITISVY